MSLEPQIFVLFAAISATLAVVSMSAGVGVVRDWRSRRSVAEALRDLEALRIESPAAPVVRSEGGESPIRRLVASLPRMGDVEDLIQAAAVRWSLERYLLYTTLWAIGIGVPLWMATRSPILAMVGLAVGAWLPRFHLQWKASKRIRALESQLPGAIDHLTRAVRAGHPLSAGIQMLADESPEPLATEFRSVFEEQRFGLPFEDALLGLGDRINLPDVRILITAILVQREVGGNLAEILEKVAGTMRARFTIRRQVRVFTVQGRMSGYILAALPIVVGSFIFLINNEYMSVLFEHPIGKALLGFAAFLQFVGFLWIRKIVNVEY